MALIPDLVIWVILALEMGGLYSVNVYSWNIREHTMSQKGKT